MKPFHEAGLLGGSHFSADYSTFVHSIILISKIRSGILISTEAVEFDEAGLHREAFHEAGLQREAVREAGASPCEAVR